MKNIRRKNYYVYIMSSINRVLYVGYTNCLVKRGRQHKASTYHNAFSKKYKTNKLVYFESYLDKKDALKREVQIKKYRKEKKINLIEKENSDWLDLYLEVKKDYYIMQGFTNVDNSEIRKISHPLGRVRD